MTNIFKDVAMTEQAYSNNVGGLEQLVNQNLKKDKNKGPLAITESLVEILALNELKGKIDASKRDIILKAGQNRGQPPTIKQQLEQNLVDQTINDKVNGVAGVLTNNLRRRNKYMNKFADRGAKSPSNINFQAPLQPLKMANFNKGIAKNKKNMNLASGGIVGYSTGETIKSILTKTLEKVKQKGGETIKNIKESDLVQKYVVPAIQELSLQKDIVLDDANEIANNIIAKIPEISVPKSEISIPGMLKGAFDKGKEYTEQGVDRAKNAVDEIIFGGEYSSPDPSVLGGGNMNTNAAVSQELGGLRSDLRDINKSIQDKEAFIKNADLRIAQNEALSDKYFDQAYKAKRYLDGFPYYDPKDAGVGRLVPGTEQDLVDRNEAIRAYATKQEQAADDAIEKFRADKRQFREELAGDREAYSDVTNELMFLQDMARKARMGDPEAIKFMNAQGKINIQKGLAGIYGNKDIDPAMMKMVEAQQFPSTLPVDSEAVKAAGENRISPGNLDGYIEQLTNYPTNSLANQAANAKKEAGILAKNIGNKAVEMLLDAGDTGIPLLEKGLDYIFGDAPPPEENINQDYKSAVVTKSKEPLTRPAAYSGGEDIDGSEEIDTGKGMVVVNNNNEEGEDKDKKKVVSSSPGTGSGSGGIGNVGSMNDVVNLISELEDRYRGEKGGYAKLIYALTRMDTRGGGGAFGRAASEFDQITYAKASETAKMAINTMLKIQENNIRARSNEIQAQLRNDARISKNVYNLRKLLLETQEAKQGFGFQFNPQIVELTQELADLTARYQNNQLEDQTEFDRLEALPAAIDAIKMSNEGYAELVAYEDAIKAQLKSLEDSLGGSGA